MNDSERLSVATSNPFSSISTTSSTSRRTQSALSFSTDTSGLLDMFAQVFAQMSTPIVAAKTTELSSSRPIESASARESDDDASESEDDASATSDVHQLGAREAFLQAIAAATSRTESTADEAEPTLDNRGAELRKVVDTKVAKSRGQAEQIDAESLTQPDALNDIATTAKLQGDAASLDAGNVRNVDSKSDAETSTAATVGETHEVVAATSEGKLDADQAKEKSLEPETTSESQFSDQQSDNDDRDSRRSSRRGERRLDTSPASDQAKVEPRSATSATANDVTAVSNEAPIPPVPPAPPTETINTSEVNTPAVLPTSAVTAATATASGTASARQTSPGTSSTSDPASAIQPAGATTSQRGSGAEKSSSTKSNSANDAVTRAKLVQRVSKAFQHLGVDGGTIRLRLAPAELGSVRVEMQVQGRKVNARVVAETEAASTILREHLPDLRARLESQGMQVERIEVETDENSFNPSRDSKHQGAQDREQDSAGRGRTEASSVSEKRSVSRPVSPVIDSSLPAVASGVDIRF